MALLVGGMAMFSSCELTDQDTDFIDNTDGGGNGGGSNNGSNIGTVEPFSVSFTYDSSEGYKNVSALDAETLQAVKISDPSADLVMVDQASYGYIVASPNAAYVKTYIWYNYPNFDNSSYNKTIVQNLGKVSIDSYSSIEKLSKLTVSSGTIENLVGSNQVQVSAGDVVAFKTSRGVIGVAKVSSLSKLLGKMTLKGYVYYSSSSN